MKKVYAIDDIIWVMYKGQAKWFSVNGIFNTKDQLMYSIMILGYSEKSYSVYETQCFTESQVFETKQDLLDSL